MANTSFKSLMESSPYSFNDEVESRILLYEILVELQGAERFFDVYETIESRLQALLRSERVIVYKRGRHKRELMSYVRIDNSLKELRLDFGPASIAGYVAMMGKPVCIQNVADKTRLAAIHPDLTNDVSADDKVGVHTRSTMAVPICYGEIVIGVMQLVNRTDGQFSPAEYKKLNMIASMLGEHFHDELGVTEGPFELLIKKGLLTEQQLGDMTRLGKEVGRSVGHLLTTDLGIARAEVGESLASFYQTPFIPAELNRGVPIKLISNINPKYICNQGWIPIAENGREVTILIDDPTDVERIMVIEQLFRGRRIKLMMMLREEIAAIAQTALGDEVDTTTIQQLTDLAIEEVDDVPEAKTVETRDDESNVVRLINRLISEAHAKGASDIHIQPEAKDRTAAVLYRIDGVCRSAARIPVKLVRPVISRLKVISGMDLAERRLPQDGKCQVRCKGQNIEVRVAIIPNAHGLENAVIRLLSNCEAMHIYGLNLSDQNLTNVKRLAESPHGLFLVVGPTGSGKTTTLHSVLGHMNTGERIIWTVEDPVEITQPGLQQVNVNRKTGLTFAAALRALLRADPDVLLVGEMRDTETALTAVQASMTGHLVFSTLHTNSAVETINRLTAMGIEPYDLADSLIGILSQRLARTNCPHCSGAHELTDIEYQAVTNLASRSRVALPPRHELEFRSGSGCSACGETGYLGRMAVHELLVVDQHVKELIGSGAPSQSITEYAQGMTSLAADALQKALAGKFDLRELRRIAVL